MCKWVLCLGANAGAQTSGYKGGATNNQLDGIPKRGVQQSSERLAQPHGDLLRRERQDGGQRDDSEEVEREDGGGSPVELTGDDAERHDDEQEVDIVCDSRRTGQKPHSSTHPHRDPSRRKLTAEERHLGDVPRRGRVPHDVVGVVGAGGAPAVEEEVLPVDGPAVVGAGAAAAAVEEARRLGGGIAGGVPVLVLRHGGGAHSPSEVDVGWFRGGLLLVAFRFRRSCYPERGVSASRVYGANWAKQGVYYATETNVREDVIKKTGPGIRS